VVGTKFVHKTILEIYIVHDVTSLFSPLFIFLWQQNTQVCNSLQCKLYYLKYLLYSIQVKHKKYYLLNVYITKDNNRINVLCNEHCIVQHIMPTKTFNVIEALQFSQITMIWQDRRRTRGTKGRCMFFFLRMILIDFLSFCLYASDRRRTSRNVLMLYIIDRKWSMMIFKCASHYISAGNNMARF